ncbi:hypothetical protein A6770_33120 [Nostoc minutum NIES-26]|uniref:Uncharacterized protein n=1 Tax=Nostoc minutum NIES-26 TaxID=1844469 RepID=A0A367Q2T0_9NOSO|nr:hypothetical protein A6770_33120 [Nostoc minutum NIES-26]
MLREDSGVDALRLAEGIAQNPKWLELSTRNDVDSEMKTHLGDVLHYLEGAMGCIEPFVEVRVVQEQVS